MCGVHFDGAMAVSTDQYRMGIMPCAIPTTEPFTVPTSVIASLVKANGGGDARVAYRNGRLLVMPNLYSQMQMVTFGVRYPIITKILDRRGESVLRVSRTALLEMLRRTQPMANLDRNPKLTLWIGKERSPPRVYRTRARRWVMPVSVPGYADHPRCKYAFSPDLLISAVENAPGTELKIFYHNGNSTGFLTILAESGYQGWVASRRQAEVQPGGPE